MQQEKFSLQVYLPGMEDNATRLNAGYILNALQTAIGEFAITCPLGKDLEWWFTMGDSAVEEILQHPAADVDAEAPPKVQAIHPNRETS